MRRTVILLLIALLLALLSPGCHFLQKRKSAQIRAAEKIVLAACEGVCEIVGWSGGSNRAVTLVFQERHNSRAGQIEQAIALARLHEQHQLRHIALEGYLRERPAISTDWFNKAVDGFVPAARARVPARLLAEGEIAGAEFHKLVFDDTMLHPTETLSEYQVSLDEEAGQAPLLYLLRIAERKMDQTESARAEQMRRSLASLSGEELRRRGQEAVDYVLDGDSWARKRAGQLQKLAAPASPAEQHLAVLQEIERRAAKSGAELRPEERRAFERNLQFWRARVKASGTIVASTQKLAEQDAASALTMIVGAGHTAGMRDHLRAANRPFLIISPLSLKLRDSSESIPWELFERKYRAGSLYSGGFMAELLGALPPAGAAERKPEPALLLPWVQAKTELYVFIDRIARTFLSSDGPPGEEGPPPDVSVAGFRGSHVFVDRNHIQVMPDGAGRAVLFPARINDRTELWVKAGLDDHGISLRERESVEGLLKRALAEVNSGSGVDGSLEDSAGRVQITLHTAAAIGVTEDAVRAVPLTPIAIATGTSPDGN
jgi:hypothetical protein